MARLQEQRSVPREVGLRSDLRLPHGRNQTAAGQLQHPRETPTPASRCNRPSPPCTQQSPRCTQQWQHPAKGQHHAAAGRRTSVAPGWLLNPATAPAPAVRRCKRRRNKENHEQGTCRARAKHLPGMRLSSPMTSPPSGSEAASSPGPTGRPCMSRRILRTSSSRRLSCAVGSIPQCGARTALM